MGIRGSGGLGISSLTTQSAGLNQGPSNLVWATNADLVLGPVNAGLGEGFMPYTFGGLGLESSAQPIGFTDAIRTWSYGAGLQLALGRLLSVNGEARSRHLAAPATPADSQVVRGLEYYTGPVYEVELTFETKDESGRPIRFGSVGGGGRYDGLVARFRGEPVPATGFSIGVSRLLAALQHLGKIDSKPEPGPVVVTVFADIPIAHYQRLVAQLREAEYAPGKTIRAELYLGDGKFGAQMKYADKRGSPCVVIQGGNEKAKGEVQIKDLILGAEIAGMSKDRDDYLKKQATAQFAVAEDKLVDAVREVLARHDVNWS